MFAKLSHAALSFLKRDDGPTPVEYAVVFALVMVACVATLSVFGTKSKPKEQNFRTKIVKTGSRR